MEINLEYQSALDYLYRYVDYSLNRTTQYDPSVFNLERIAELLERLGNPHKKYRVIHVAGTKGKGSVAAMIASALQMAGYRTGFFTSPHLVEYTERIKVNGVEIGKDELVALVNEMKPQIEAVERITTFEITTALSFLYFARKNVDVAVVEVGLGGRLDATNVVQPLVSVITSLSMDHMAILGNSLEKIAFEKAGIIKPGRPVVVSPQKPEALETVARAAQERGSRLVLVGRDVRFAPWSSSLDGQTMLIWRAEEQDRMDAYLQEDGLQGWEPLEVFLPLLGQHQVQNAATAYAALQVAQEEGLVLTEADILKGFAYVVWPARFEVLRRDPPVVIDSAHNRDSALKLRLAIDDYLPGKDVVLLFGASDDKDVEGMFIELMPRVCMVVASESLHPRAMAAEKIVKLAHQFGRPAVMVKPVENALEYALQQAGADAAVVVAGSMFMAAAVRELWFASLDVKKELKG
ncbi:MAG: bifunctional folylpolyglutamate synthase/dihydrofolate synthase [Chloroflexi bacterium]|nr:bifunctional folylpolyglutamate synthase/dihydrofolate synthase [Chloroflexota bacterium]